MNQKKYLNILYLIFVCLKFSMVELSESEAAKYCAIKKINYLNDFLGKEIFYKETIGLKCDIKNSDFTLDINSYNILANKIQEYRRKKRKKLWKVEFNWRNDRKASNSLTNQFNISAFSSLFYYFEYYPCVYFHNLNKIELQLFSESYKSMLEIHLINSDLKFTIDGKAVRTCADITSRAKNETFTFSSLFQIPLVGLKKNFYLFGCRFSQKLCPTSSTLILNILEYLIWSIHFIK